MTNWSDVTRHNRYRKHNNTSNVGNASKRQKETMDVMGKSEECENDGFFDDNHLYSTVAPDVDKMMIAAASGGPDLLEGVVRGIKKSDVFNTYYEIEGLNGSFTKDQNANRTLFSSALPCLTSSHKSKTQGH